MAVGTARRFLGWTNLLVAAALTITLWGGLTILSSQRQFRSIIDFSPQERFSLSPRTEALIDELAERGLKAEFYVLPMLPPQTELTEEARHLLGLRMSVQQYTIDLLQLMDARGGEAVQLRVLGFQDRDEIRRVSGKYNLPGYGSVLVVVGDRYEVHRYPSEFADYDLGNRGVPGRQPLPTLQRFTGEAVVSSTLQELLFAGRPKVYVLEGYGPSGLFGDAAGTGYSVLFDTLKKDGIDIEPLKLQEGDEIPEDAAAIAILEPRRRISQRVVDQIGDYVRGGGRMLVNPIYQVPEDRNVSLDRLGARFGFEVGPYLLCRPVVDRQRRGAERYGLPQNSAFEIRNMNPVHPTTKSLADNGVSVVVKDARPIRRSQNVPEGVVVDPSGLVTHPRTWEDPDADRIPDQSSRPGPRSVGTIIDVEGEGTRGHAYILSGMVFRDGAMADNREFALSMFNWLAKREVLVAIPSKQYKASRLKLSLGQKETASWFVAAWFPGGLAVLAVFVMLWRRR